MGSSLLWLTFYHRCVSVTRRGQEGLPLPALSVSGNAGDNTQLFNPLETQETVGHCRLNRLHFVAVSEVYHD